MKVEDIKTLLNSYIVKGRYHSLDLTTTPVKVETMNPDAIMYLSLRPQNNDAQNKFEVRINDVVNSGKGRFGSDSQFAADQWHYACGRRLSGV